MLPWLAQAPAADSGGWTVTTSIAAAAAVISLATLVVTTIATGRRERQKWAREALSEAFFELLDASNEFSEAIADYQLTVWEDEPDALRKEMFEAMERAKRRHRRADSKIQLLAPRDSREAATELRARLREARRAVRPDVTKSTYDAHAARITEARQNLLGRAKKAMSLPR